MKTCSNIQCKKNNPQVSEEFYFCARTKDKLESQCKSCRRLSSQIRRDLDLHDMKNYLLKYRYGISSNEYADLSAKQYM